MNGFHAANVAMQIAEQLKPVVEEVKKRDAELADQLYRAAKSLALAVPEGGKRGGKDRAYHFRIGAGSAAELVNGLRFAIAWRHCPPQPALLDLLDHELAMLWKLERAMPK